LHFYTDPREYAAALGAAGLMRELGCERNIVDRDQIVKIEPAFKHSIDRIVGGTYTPSDESGDAHLFTRRLARLCEQQGVKFLYNTTVAQLRREADAVVGAQIVDAEGRASQLKADCYVVSLGAYSARLTRPVGVDMEIYPAKGYSATLSTEGYEATPSVSMTDDGYKLVFSRLGNRLRIAGTAELNGYDRNLNFIRCDALVKRTQALFPTGADYARPVFWTGLRPATPSNVPYIGRSKLSNLYLNTGHGTLGWTMGPGSGKAIAEIVSGKRPEVDFSFDLARA
jgi:D-amino-acid dehydrogenase